jgi:3,4-dihydroxy 2-butanone 4-phosphate synthase/GTP cyclohydrolase II
LPAAVARCRPFVTLSYAQSLDGSIAGPHGAPLRLSGPEALCLTHRLRASHDAILVGIGTILADDPRLTVRLVQGDSPQPIVLDSRLRFPLTAQLLRDGQRRPWVATTAAADPGAVAALTLAGATVLTVLATDTGRVDLAPLLADLAARGIQRLMVEGGAAVITSFLDEGLVDQLVITVSPRLIAGVRAVSASPRPLPSLRNVHWQRLGDDLVVRGDLARDRP